MNEEKDSYGFIDNKEYQARFLLDPDIDKKNESDFSHFDKNFAITNLKHNAKLGIDEPNEMRSILRGLHVLNNITHHTTAIKEVQVGWKEITREDKSVVRVPVFKQTRIQVSNFPKTIHALNAEVIAMVNTSAARNGHRIDKAITNKLVKEETLSQRTEVPNKWGFGRK